MLPRWLLLLSVVGAVVHASDDDVVTVPTDLMQLILGCQRVDPARQGAVPVYSVDINEQEGTTSQKFGMLNMDELGLALRSTVDNEAVVAQIMAQVRDAVSASASDTKEPGHCNIENKINIALPPDEVEDFNDRMQQMTQNNNYILLKQMNNLVNFKLDQQSVNTEKMIKRKLKQINEKLDLVLQALGKEVEEDDDDDNDDDNDDDDNDNDDDVDIDFITEAPSVEKDESIESGLSMLEEILEPEPEPESEPGCKCKNKTHTHSSHEASTDPEDDPESEPETEPEPTPETEPEPEPETSKPEPEPTSSEHSSEEITTTMSPLSEEEPTSSEEQPDVQTETITTFLPRPSSSPKPTPMPVSELITIPIGSSGTSSEENSQEASTSDERTTGFERVAQKPSAPFDTTALLRPLMRRPPLLINRPQPAIHHRERVPIVVPVI